MKPATYFQFPERNQRTLERIRGKEWKNDPLGTLRVNNKFELKQEIGTTDVNKYAELCMVGMAQNRIFRNQTTPFNQRINDIMELYDGEVEREQIEKVLVGLFSGNTNVDGESIDTGKSLFTSEWKMQRNDFWFGTVNTSINEKVMFEEYDVLRFHTREEREEYETSENKCWAFGLLGSGDYYFGLIIGKGSAYSHLITNESGNRLNFSFNYSMGFPDLEGYYLGWKSGDRAFMVSPMDDVFLNAGGQERIVSYNHHRGFKL